MDLRSDRAAAFARSFTAGLAFTAAIGFAAAFAPAKLAAASGAHAAGAAAFSASEWQASALGALNPKVFELAIGAASCAVRSGSVPSPATLTVIDYSLPSTSKRLWVFDLKAHTLLNEERVAHGQGSGDNLATRFSNQDDSHQS